MKTMKNVKVVVWGLLALCVLCITVMQFGAIPGGDEFSYAFEGQRDSHVDNPHRVGSFTDIVQQQWNDYHFRGNGRVVLHSIVAFSSWKGLYWVARVINVGLWFLLVYLVMVAGRGRRSIAISEYLGGFCLFYWFVYYAEIGGGNFAFSINYIWSPCMMLGMYFAWRNLNSWLLVPLSFLFGWTQELFVLPFIGTVLLMSVYRWIGSKERKVDAMKIVAWISMVVAACFLCFGPASRNRAGGLSDGLVLEAARNWGHLLLIGTPVLLLAILAYIAIKKRGVLFASDESRWWWTYLVLSIGLYTVVSKGAYLRTGANWFIAGTIIVVQNREVFARVCSAWIKKALMAFIVFWMVCAAIIQTYIGFCSYRMVALYRKNPHGITYMPTIQLGPFLYTCNNSCCNGWYLQHFMLMYGKDCFPNVFAEIAYKNIYENSSVEHATAIDVQDCYVFPELPSAVFKRGDGKLSESESRTIDDYIKNAKKYPAWTRFLPGRVFNMFPRAQQSLNSREFTFRDLKGETWTVYSR